MPEAKPKGDEAQVEQVEEEAGEETVGVDLEAVADELAAAEGFVEERVQRALAPYRGMLSPAVLEEYADDLRCFLLTHPAASRMLARIRPRAQRSSSGEGVIMGLPSDDASPARKDGAG